MEKKGIMTCAAGVMTMRLATGPIDKMAGEQRCLLWLLYRTESGGCFHGPFQSQFTVPAILHCSFSLFFFFTSHNLHYEYDDSVVFILFHYDTIWVLKNEKNKKIAKFDVEFMVKMKGLPLRSTEREKGEKMEGRSNPLRYPVAAGKPRCYLSFILIPSIIINLYYWRF